jgi:hypothetical protein
MTNYSQDEDDRRRDKLTRAERSKVSSVELGKDELPHMAIDIELPDDIFKRLALQAHERDMTFNKLAINILKKGLQDKEYKFEHSSNPQLLNEKY